MQTMAVKVDSMDLEQPFIDARRPCPGSPQLSHKETSAITNTQHPEITAPQTAHKKGPACSTIRCHR